MKACDYILCDRNQIDSRLEVFPSPIWKVYVTTGCASARPRATRSGLLRPSLLGNEKPSRGLLVRSSGLDWFLFCSDLNQIWSFLFLLHSQCASLHFYQSEHGLKKMPRHAPLRLFAIGEHVTVLKHGNLSWCISHQGSQLLSSGRLPSSHVIYMGNVFTGVCFRSSKARCVRVDMTQTWVEDELYGDAS
jgi:hypothetical protein